VSHRAAPRATNQVRRRTFVATALGQSIDRSITPLKEYLHAAGLTKRPDEKLDLVMVEDYDHFAELLARHGVPLARDDMDRGDRVVRYVTIRCRRRPFLAMSLVLLALVSHDVVFDILNLL
jgi:hypothetical protein